MDAAGGDVGGHQDRDLAVLEPGQGPGALGLGLPAVQGRGAHPDGQQLLGQPVGGVLGVQEHDHASVAGGDLRRGGVLVVVLHVQQVMLHRGDRVRRRIDRVDDGVVEVAADQAVDVAVQRGREQQPLAIGAHLVEQGRHLGHEAHVGHLVGLVQDGDRDPVQPAVAAVYEVLEPAGRRDDDLGTGAQRARLAADRHPADHRGEPQAQRAGVGGERVGDLLGQFPGGHEDEGHRLLGLGPLPVDTGQHGQAEGEGLARPRAPAAQDVPAGQRVRQRRRLDRERLGDALALQRGQQLLGQVEVGERLDGGQCRGEGGGRREFAAGGGTAPGGAASRAGRTGGVVPAPRPAGVGRAVVLASGAIQGDPSSMRHVSGNSRGQTASGGPHQDSQE